MSHKAIRLFCEEYPGADSAMDHWYRVAKRATWGSFAEVKQSFNTADFVTPYVVFDLAATSTGSSRRSTSAVTSCSSVGL
ncbi:MAG: type II toxin-antitoxin system HigB family toxin [Acidobacteria bacterium]|nr:type II toxin-antitoxin system HigB family toxin [Acidobacteriota bacterium]